MKRLIPDWYDGAVIIRVARDGQEIGEFSEAEFREKIFSNEILPDAGILGGEGSAKALESSVDAFASD